MFCARVRAKASLVLVLDAASHNLERGRKLIIAILPPHTVWKGKVHGSSQPSALHKRQAMQKGKPDLLSPLTSLHSSQHQPLFATTWLDQRGLHSHRRYPHRICVKAISKRERKDTTQLK